MKLGFKFKISAQTTSPDLYTLKFGAFAKIHFYNSPFGKAKERVPLSHSNNGTLMSSCGHLEPHTSLWEKIWVGIKGMGMTTQLLNIHDDGYNKKIENNECMVAE